MYIKLAKIQEQRSTRILFKLIEVLVTAMIIAVKVEVPATALLYNSIVQNVVRHRTVVVVSLKNLSSRLLR